MSHDIATCVYYTGIDPFTKQEVFIARHLRDRKMQRALMQFFKPENWFLVREALIQAGRTDLIGSGCDSLISAQPPREALEARRQQAKQAACSEYVHEIPNPVENSRNGYRPGRKTANRQQKKTRAGSSPSR
jgi:Domain of unknown function (DUF3362)